MTCAQFIKRLSGLNDGGNFPVELLRRLYNAIKGMLRQLQIFCGKVQIPCFNYRINRTTAGVGFGFPGMCCRSRPGADGDHQRTQGVAVQSLSRHTITRPEPGIQKGLHNAQVLHGV